MTAARMTSGDELKYRSGLAALGFMGWVIARGYQPPASLGEFALTVPLPNLKPS
jgi:hypothetical protein